MVGVRRSRAGRAEPSILSELSEISLERCEARRSYKGLARSLTMRSLRFFLAMSLCLEALSCGDSTPETPPVEGLLVVFVEWDNVGIAGKRIQVVELNQERRTDSTGIAEFVVPPGRYTVRAYGINSAGPPPPYVELMVTLGARESFRVTIADCLPCVRMNQRAEPVRDPGAESGRDGSQVQSRRMTAEERSAS